LSCAIVLLGFWAPWIQLLHWGGRANRTWGWLVFQLGGTGISSTAGFELITSLAIASAALGAVLRIWGTAYLGTGTVFNAEMKAGQVLADGPYRYMRNPLYLGSFLTIAAISILMPPSGTAASLILLAVFLWRLILGEEAFLKPKLGEPYAAYCKTVPSLIPSLRPRVAAGGKPANWTLALVGEIFPLAVFASFAVLSWQFDPELLVRATLISFGISLVARAFLPPRPDEHPTQQPSA